MAYESTNITVGNLKAAADLRTYQYCAVALSGNNAVDVATSGAIFGVLQNKPNTGEAAEVIVAGVTKWIASTTISAAGTKLMPTTGGKAATSTGSATVVAGVALNSAGSSGTEVIDALIFGGVGHVIP